MKKLFYLFLFASGTFLISCSDDDSNDVVTGVSGVLDYGDATISITSGLASDYSAFVEDDGYSSYDFYLADGEISHTTTDDIFDGNPNQLVLIELYQESSSFTGGTFTFTGELIELSNYAAIENSDSEEIAVASSGTVTATRSGESWTLVINLTFDEVDEVGQPTGNTETLTGTVAGNFPLRILD